jgi:hypothetical protein
MNGKVLLGVLLGVCLATMLLMGCSKNANSSVDAQGSDPTSPINTSTITPAPSARLSETHKDSLFGEIAAYDGKTARSIEIDKRATEAKWTHLSYSDFGVYAPSSLNVKKLNEGQTFQFGDDPISEFKITNAKPGIEVTIEEDLSSFKEYLGSVISKNETGQGDEQEAIRYDYFEISFDNIKGYVTFKYKIKAINEVRPFFIDVMKNVKYEDERTMAQ